MSPSDERSEINATIAALEAAIAVAFDDLMEQVRAGVPPRDAVAKVLDAYSGEMAEKMAEGLSAVMAESMGTEAALEYRVGTVSLSRKLYMQGASTSADVERIVRDHVRGFQSVRKLALDLYEGYEFRQPGQEPLRMNRRNQELPKYLREAVMATKGAEGEISRAFAKIQADKLQTSALRAAYKELLAVVDKIEAGAGAKVLERKLKVAFFERMRYFSERIARTELHRAYMDREAKILMEDGDIEYVQVRRAPGRGDACICSLITGRDQYGLGPGVYPKRKAPKPPYHPHCRCVLSPRVDLTGRKERPENPDADRYFLARLGESMQGAIMGSKAKAGEVFRGSKALDVLNKSIAQPEYRVRQVGEML